jgi:hypothetical protein
MPTHIDQSRPLIVKLDSHTACRILTDFSNCRSCLVVDFVASNDLHQIGDDIPDN